MPPAPGAPGPTTAPPEHPPRGRGWRETGSWAYVTPHANWRGDWSYGTFANGNLCLGTGPTCPNWPGATQTADGSSQGTSPPTYTVWWGSIIRDRADATGLQYLRNRYYDPKTGRFTQQDPIGLAGGMNLYGFADGDPVDFSDPFELSPFDSRKVKCPSIETVQANRTVRRAGEAMTGFMAD
jgi:RHS repeat-associated protein